MSETTAAAANMVASEILQLALAGVFISAKVEDSVRQLLAGRVAVGMELTPESFAVELAQAREIAAK